MILRNLIIIVFFIGSLFANGQTDFPALKQQFLDYRNTNKQDSALYIARKMNQLALKEQTDTSYWYALSMRYQGNPYETWGNKDSTIFYWKKTIELFVKYHPKHPEFAETIDKLGVLYKEMGDYKATESYFKQALEIRKKAFGEEHPDYAKSLFRLGNLYFITSDFKSSESYYKKALDIRKKALGENHQDVAEVISRLVAMYSIIKNYKEAISLLEQFLEIKRKALGELHTDYVFVLNDLGDLYLEMGEYKLAERNFKQSLEILKIALGEDHQDYAKSLTSLGKFYSIYINDYKSAEPLFKKALGIKIKVLGEDHPDVAECLADLGLLYYSMGDFKSAESYYKRDIEIRQKDFGENVLLYANSLARLGTFYIAIGEHKAAETLFKQAIEITKKELPEEHPVLSYYLHYLGVLYSNIEDYKKAEILHTTALDIRKIFFGEEHPDIANSLEYLADLYFHIGNYKSAEEAYKKSLEIIRFTLGEKHQDYAKILNSLGFFYYKTGDYMLSEPFYRQALDILQKTLGEDHPKYLDCQNWLAYLLTRTDREQIAYKILLKNINKKSKQISDNFEWLNDNQKEAYWKKESAFYDDLSWFAHEAHEKVPESVGLNYNAALVTKSKMLEAKISNENYYREVDEIREELAYRRRLLAKMESDGSTEKEKLEKLRHEADSLDKRLTLSWPEYAQQKKNLSITWDQVQQNLDKGEAAIEFVRFKNEEDYVVYYNALVLKKGDHNPTLVKLCKEKELQSISAKMGYSAYYSLIWQPLEEALKDINTIYYAPTGELYNVPFHAIYAPKGKGDELIAAKTNKRGITIENEKTITENNAEYLMDRYTMHQLTSTRYLAMGLKQKAKETIGNTIAMVGGVNYDYLPGSKTSTKKNKKEKNASRSSASASGKLNYLEGTKTEAEQINLQVTSSSWQTKLLENNEPIEENITKLEGKEAKGILHLATHGYAFPEYDFKDTSINKNSLRYSYRYSTNPMVRSGLILTGGNWAWTGSDTLTKLGAEQNGILTALEVSQLNLKKTKLVVLSACETGLGKIEGSEGTFGLKRGFKLAGVEQIIVSLWSVPDKETMELMTLFYSDLTKTLNPIISFEKAQKEMRNKYPTEPEKWAGFVLVR